MKIIAFAYFVLSVVASFGGFDAGFWVGLSGILSPTLCLFAGSGTRGMFYHQRYLAGSIAGMIVGGLGIFFVETTGYWIQLFDMTFYGYQWCLVGLVLGYAATSKTDAEVPDEDSSNT